MSDPLDKVRLLMKAVMKRAQDNGLVLKNFVIIPSEDGKNDFVNIGMVITPEALETLEETEQRQTDDEFSAMMSGVELEGFDSELPEGVQERVDMFTEEILGEYDESNAGEDDGSTSEPD